MESTKTDIDITRVKFWTEEKAYDIWGDGWRGAWVEERVADSVQFAMREGDEDIAMGVMLMDDGTVYTWCIRKDGHGGRAPGGEERRRLARRSDLTYFGAVRKLFAAEKPFMDSGRVAGYAAMVRAL